MSAELIERSITERHRELCEQLSSGVVSMCTALWRIRGEKTFRAQGCASFGEFLARSGISAASGRLHANIGPALLELQKTGHADLVKHAELLKPIHLMIGKAARENDEAAAERIGRKQAEIVRLAAEVAKRSQVPLTAKILEEVAEKNYRWLSDKKRKALAKEPEEPKPFEHPFRANVRAVIDYARVQLAGMEPEAAVQYARVNRLPGFADLTQWFIDVDEAARKLDHLAPELWSEADRPKEF